ncbi:MAG: hypothetical protein JWR70_3397 [Modestobacter sp.]|nr:hypothetical protein [Modestobacter sp.]
MLLFLLALGGLAVATLVIAVRGGRGPGDPPASHDRSDPAGFPVLPEPRGVFPRHPVQPVQSRGPRRSRLAAARTAALVHTARESRVARRTSPRTGG